MTEKSSPPGADSTAAYFSTRLKADANRKGLWQVLCRHLQKDIPRDDTVLELGGGYCDFINNIRAAEKHVVDLFAGIEDVAERPVITHVQSCTRLDGLADEYFDTVFASNLFEHLTREELLQTLSEVKRVLRPGGQLLIIQPNFRYAFREYFDDYTHVQVFTDRGMVDLLAAHGFTAERVIPRFLPFSLKSRRPTWPWLLRLYLRLPWRPFAGQMYIVTKTGRAAS